MQAAAIVVAAGRGTRMGGTTPKQFQMLAGRSVLECTLHALAAHTDIVHLIVVLHADEISTFADRIVPPEGPKLTLVAGGDTRDASVKAGLAVLHGSDLPAVLIHDAARPCLSPWVVDRVLDALHHAPGAAPALTVTDALWRGENGAVEGTQERRGLFRAQTPQGFHCDAIIAAHAAHPGGAADDVEVARAHGLDVRIVAGEEDNIKITLPGDLARAEAIVARRRESALDIRTGNGFDVHRFGPGDAVMLCGVAVPHSAGLMGHSDADVGMHAVTDALYGALAEGDIGQHFPPSDPQWKGAASEVFLRHAADLARERGFAIANTDCTLVCEHPKIGPHVPAMRREMARLLDIDESRVSVKATTSERLGFTGREEGIAALASATLVRS